LSQRRLLLSVGDEWYRDIEENAFAEMTEDERQGGNGLLIRMISNIATTFGVMAAADGVDASDPRWSKSAFTAIPWRFPSLRPNSTLLTYLHQRGTAFSL
jgi:hypothetical protein